VRVRPLVRKTLAAICALAVFSMGFFAALAMRHPVRMAALWCMFPLDAARALATLVFALFGVTAMAYAFVSYSAIARPTRTYNQGVAEPHNGARRLYKVRVTLVFCFTGAAVLFPQPVHPVGWNLLLAILSLAWGGLVAIDLGPRLHRMELKAG